jgi:CheY-like chemotaxis protein
VTALDGRRILVVEDEALVAAMLVEILEDLRAVVVGPAGNVATGLPLAQSAEIDAAILDVNLRGEWIDPVALTLRARGIPFVFATGYGTAPRDGFDGVPVLDKPYTDEGLVLALTRAFDAPPRAADPSP